jgi:hypothetical protein
MKGCKDVLALAACCQPWAIDVGEICIWINQCTCCKSIHAFATGNCTVYKYLGDWCQSVCACEATPNNWVLSFCTSIVPDNRLRRICNSIGAWLILALHIEFLNIIQCVAAQKNTREWAVYFSSSHSLRCSVDNTICACFSRSQAVYNWIDFLLACL